MNKDLLDIIRIANREFQEFIEQAAQSRAKVVESGGAVHRLGRVDLRLKQVAKYLAAESGSSTQAPEDVEEVLKYRDNLKALRSAIETLQFSLLAEKARLKNIRVNLQAARAWATSLREIS